MGVFDSKDLTLAHCRKLHKNIPGGYLVFVDP